MCNHVQPLLLKFKLQGHCEWWSFSFATISIATHVITDSYSRTQAKDDPIEYSFQGFDEHHHSDSFEPVIAVSSSVRIDVRSSLHRRGIPAASRRQVFQT